jgi:hypothetical protein
MSLPDWLHNRWITADTPSVAGMEELFKAAEQDLIVCRVPDLTPDWRLAIAYTAALRLATAALAASGYRPGHEQQHYRVIQSLAHTIGASPDLIAEFDYFRKKRNISSYERMGTISSGDAEQMTALAEHIKKLVLDWLKENHPDLFWG